MKSNMAGGDLYPEHTNIDKTMKTYRTKPEMYFVQSPEKITVWSIDERYS
mgnify:FL=1